MAPMNSLLMALGLRCPYNAMHCTVTVYAICNTETEHFNDHKKCDISVLAIPSKESFMLDKIYVYLCKNLHASLIILFWDYSNNCHSFIDIKIFPRVSGRVTSISYHYTQHH